ncbi:MAG: 16S rRNA (cytidine(1402)-2'-O)-methyltransferase [Candidatus Moranbacteria bacterium]|nr:16S rRNA (cytidine(1402)-2'-O)-methyltransferase [Candidatus Moranbacteria bacterium]
MSNTIKTTGTLYIVATPIGNLGDITLRALETLKSVEAILCEDTRVTKKLLFHYEITKTTLSFHEHSDARKIVSLLERLQSGDSLALVTDAGTPGLSDPGNVLVEEALKQEIKVVPIPGVSALTALVSVAGIDMREFVFLGFPPHKKGRQTFFQKVSDSQMPVMYYESPHRVLKNLELLRELNAEKKIILGRELTKMFEEVVQGGIEEVQMYFQKHPEKVKGEFTIIVY